jgi:FkbM family methyltransferase
MQLVDAVLVEPLPQLCAILRKRYESNPSVHIAECAIGTESGEMPFYFFEDNFGTDLTVYSSLDRSRMEKVLRQLNDRARSEGSGQRVSLRSAPVAVRTADEIIADRGWTGLDVLVVDAEGLDGELVMSALASGLSVDCVFFEYCNLLPPEFLAVTSALKERGYRLAQSGKDMLALHDSVEERRAAAGRLLGAAT